MKDLVIIERRFNFKLNVKLLESKLYISRIVDMIHEKYK